MGCMKCGRDVSGGEVFCQDCRLAMQKYPVDPGTVIQLPLRREGPPSRRPAKRRAPSPEEQVRALRRRLRAAVVVIIVLLALLAGTAYPTFRYISRDRRPTGQNYSVTGPADGSMDVSRETLAPEP